MDPISIAGPVVGLLIPVFQRMAERGVDRVTEVLEGESEAVIGRLYQRIRAKFAGDSYNEQMLDGAQANPDSASRQANLETAVREAIESDNAFGRELAALIEEAKPGTLSSVQATNSGITAGGAISITAHGDVTGRDKLANAGPQGD